VVLVRPLHPADTAEVLGLHTRLTQQDTYFRFFGARPSGLDKLAAEMTADPGPGHYAVGCYRRGELVGVANYEVLKESTEAEVALVVDATVRTQGVATLLMEHLVSRPGKPVSSGWSPRCSPRTPRCCTSSPTSGCVSRPVSAVLSATS
jgi:GNAT superfamily N-acetyltransferase